MKILISDELAGNEEIMKSPRGVSARLDYKNAGCSAGHDGGVVFDSRMGFHVAGITNKALKMSPLLSKDRASYLFFLVSFFDALTQTPVVEFSSKELKRKKNHPLFLI